MEAIMEPLEHMQKFGRAASFGPPYMKTQKTIRMCK
jgi:hypothetical protein